MSNFQEIFEERKQQEIADLESRSKELHELVITEKFTVNEVEGESQSTLFTPYSESIMGGCSPVYSGGFTSGLVLHVLPDNPDVPIRTIYFNGTSPVEARRRISAKIPRYKEEKRCHQFPDGDRVFYLERGFKPEESAIELALLSSDGHVSRRDRSVNYKDFVKE